MERMRGIKVKGKQTEEGGERASRSRERETG